MAHNVFTVKRLALLAATVVAGLPLMAQATGIDTANTSTPLPFSIGGQQMMTLTTAGLGIGTPPIRMLTVSDELSMTTYPWGTAYLNISDATGSNGGSLDIRGLGSNGSAELSLASLTLNAKATSIMGSANVSGEVVGQITSASPYSQFRMYNATYGSMWRNDGGNTYLLLTNANDGYGIWNGLRPFYVNDATGAVTMGNSLSVSSDATNLAANNGAALVVGNGNLHVAAGSIQVAGDATCNASKAGTISFANGQFLGCNGAGWIPLSANPPANANATIPNVCSAITDASGNIQFRYTDGTLQTTAVSVWGGVGIGGEGYNHGPPAYWSMNMSICTGSATGISSSVYTMNVNNQGASISTTGVGSFAAWSH